MTWKIVAFKSESAAASSDRLIFFNPYSNKLEEVPGGAPHGHGFTINEVFHRRSLPRRLTRPSPGHRPSTSRDPGVWKSFKKSADSKPMVSMAMLCWMIVLANQGGCRSLRDSNVLLNGSCAGSYSPDNVSTKHDGNAPTEDYNFSEITFLNAEEWLARLREPR